MTSPTKRHQPQLWTPICRNTVHDPAVPARRARRRTRPAGHHRQNALAAQTPAQFADLGPGSGTRPAQTDRRLAGHGRLLLRPALPVAARHQREHQRAPAPVLPQRHRPIRLPGGLPRRGRRGTQRPATQNPRLHETKREDHRTARRRVITSTTDNVAMEGRSNLRCCNHR